MYKIKNIPIDSADKLEIKNKLWGMLTPRGVSNGKKIREKNCKA